MKLNLGCGNNPKKGYLNIDKIKTDKVDRIWDLNKYPYPFKSNSIEEIYCSHVLEHLDDFDKAVKEFHRILKVGGIARIIVPDFSSPNAFVPEHRYFFNFNSFNPFCRNIPNDMNANENLFEMVKREIIFPYEHFKRFKKLLVYLLYLLPTIAYDSNPNIYMIYLSHLFPASEIHFTLRKI